MADCPTRRKRKYGTRDQALAAREHSGQRAYQCGDHWHLSGSNTPGQWLPKEAA